MDLNDALQKGLLDMSEESPKATEAPATDDAELLYEEFKAAPDSKAGLAALKQLVRILK